MQLFKSCFRNIWKHGTNCSAKCLQLRPQHKNYCLYDGLSRKIEGKHTHHIEIKRNHLP